MDFPVLLSFRRAKPSPLQQGDLPALTSFKFGSLSSAGGGQAGVCLMCLFLRIEGFRNLTGSIIQLDQFGSIQTDHVGDFLKTLTLIQDTLASIPQSRVIQRLRCPSQGHDIALMPKW